VEILQLSAQGLARPLLSFRLLTQFELNLRGPCSFSDQGLLGSVLCVGRARFFARKTPGKFSSATRSTRSSRFKFRNLAPDVFSFRPHCRINSRWLVLFVILHCSARAVGACSQSLLAKTRVATARLRVRRFEEETRSLPRTWRSMFPCDEMSNSRVAC